LIGGDIVVEANAHIRIPGPWILNDGILSVSPEGVNTGVFVIFGYETWPAIRAQPPG